MNPFSCRIFGSPVRRLHWFWTLVAAILAPLLEADAVDVDRIKESVRLYDQLLAKPADRENSVLIDDMRFKLETLRGYRELLKGALSKSMGTQGAFDFGELPR
jgi:hypothetical protein